MAELAPAAKSADPLGGIYDQDAEQARLVAIFERRYSAMLTAVNGLVGEALGIEDFRLDDADVRRVLLEVPARVLKIDAATRTQMIDVIAEGQRRGYSAYEIARGVPKDGYPGIDGTYRGKWRSRAETIARTEIQHAQLISAVSRYRASGLVDRVQIHDGDKHEPCAARNGRVVPLEQAPALLHPNCRLAVSPILREGVA